MVCLDMKDKAKLSREEEQILIVNLVRELLYNVAKHAKTDKAAIEVRLDKKHIFIKVEDKGVGFDLEQEKKYPLQRHTWGYSA